LLGKVYLENLDLRWQLVYEKSIPDVELIDYLEFDSNNIATGSATGFVAFTNKENQPKNLRQYIRISASNEFRAGKQVFYLTDIVKMDALSPRYFDPVPLMVQAIANRRVTLSDANNNLYFIDVASGEISTFDETGDNTVLITSESEFRDFMRDFYSYI
jgi:hypothetical protein